jgi:large subunit ribosomal protein L32e
MRNALRSRKPRFIRQESWRYKRVKPSWRRPRGKTSKMRREQRGWPKTVAVGYKVAKRVRGLHPSGFREILIHRLEDLEKIDVNAQVARIAATVGEKKRIAILERAKALNIRILNPGPAKKPEEVEAEAEEVEAEKTELEKAEAEKPETSKETASESSGGQ